MATAWVIDVEARGEGYGVFAGFDARVDAYMVEKRVVVLYEPCVGVVGHAYAIDGGDETVARAEIVLDLQIALCIALQAGEDGLIGGGGGCAQGVDMCTVGDGPLGGSSGVLPDDSH